MFELHNCNAKLATVNPRTELHGQDHVPACDLIFSFDASNDILAMFHPSLRSCLYQKDETPADMFPEPGALTVYRFPAIEKFRWHAEYDDASLTVHYGVSGQKDVELEEVGIDNFTITPKQGGTCTVSFRAKARPTEDQLGRLCTWIQAGLMISVSQPEPAADLAGETKDAKQTPKQAAEAMFADGSAAEAEPAQKKPRKKVKAPGEWPFPAPGSQGDGDGMRAE